jgi:hypothetical protein
VAIPPGITVADIHEAIHDFEREKVNHGFSASRDYV